MSLQESSRPSAPEEDCWDLQPAQKKLPGSQLLQSVASHAEAAQSDMYKPVQHRPLGSYSVRPSWTPSFPSDNMMQFTNIPTLSLNLLQHFGRRISSVRSHIHDFMVHEPPRIPSLIWNQILSPRQTSQQVSTAWPWSAHWLCCPPVPTASFTYAHILALELLNCWLLTGVVHPVGPTHSFTALSLSLGGPSLHEVLSLGDPSLQEVLLTE